MNCNTPVNKDGAEAKDWRGGKPVRVIRNAKGRKHSKYAPEDGNRYVSTELMPCLVYISPIADHQNALSLVW